VNRQHSSVSTQIRQSIDAFLAARLKSKPKNPARDDPKPSSVRETWLADAARRVAQIQLVTHTLKAVHPDARGTNLFVDPADLAKHEYVGSHCLNVAFARDVFGNAAALDVYKFLKLEVAGRTVLELAIAKDEALLSAMSDDLETSRKWAEQFAAIREPRGDLSSHSRAKQIFWLVGDDPKDHSKFHLLAPLYASSLAHEVYRTVDTDRFGESSKAARDAKNAKKYSDTPVRYYPDLVIQKLGGTKPQNISQLNSDRKGGNYLLASCPPIWKSNRVSPVLGSKSFFQIFGRQKNVRNDLEELKSFLEKNPPNNSRTAAIVTEKVELLISHFLNYTEFVRDLDPNWTANPACNLPEHQKRWLDPKAPRQNEVPAEDVVQNVSEDFARWINVQLRKKLSVGDEQYVEWRKRVIDELKLRTRQAVEFDPIEALS
jgi:CRISPR-associated protein Csy1